LCLLISFFSSSANAQPYLTENATWQENLTLTTCGSLAFGDIDNDGDLDLALTGCNDLDEATCTGYVAKIYINNGTTLTENQTWEQSLTGVNRGSLAWGDVDNDGDLDLALVGGSETGRIAKIYINNGTTLVENSKWQVNLTPLDYGTAVAFGDVDNDGDLDLALAGSTGEPWYEFTEVYINNGTTFVENLTWSENLLDVEESSLAFADFDNDGDLDLTLIGHTTGDNHYIYINNGTTFVESQGSGPTGDLAGIFDGSVAFGDYNNDGFLDIVANGYEGYTTIYRYNTSESIFTDYTEDSENVMDLEFGSVVVWSDIDSDNDLDLMEIGWGGGGDWFQAKIYTNNITPSNDSPSPPSSNFSNSYSDGKLTLSYGNGSDTETLTVGLYYNLKVGMCSGCHDIVSGVYGSSSNPTAGYFGNMMQRRSITLNRYFKPGTTIYWAVQTIDTGLAKSEWSEEQVYTILDTVPPSLFNVRNGTVSWSSALVLFDTDKQGNATVNYGVNKTNLNLTYSNSTLALNHTLTLTGLEDNTTYYYNVTSCNPYDYCNTSGIYNFTTLVCVPEWSCTGWGLCQPDNTQSCNSWVDSNNCGVPYTGSDTRSCSYSPGGPSGYSPPAETHTFDKIVPGIPATKEITEGITVKIDVKTRVNNVDLAVAKLAEKPTVIAKSVKGKVYQYLEINSSGIDDSDIQSAVIEFRVSKDWISQNNIDKHSVTLYRYYENVWEALETELIEGPSITGSMIANFFRLVTGLITGFAAANNDYYYYRAQTPGFSYFAITGEETATAPLICNNNSVCELELGEDETNCPSDCALAPGQICNPGSKRCSGNELQGCNPLGTVWIAREACVHGCNSTALACNPGPERKGWEVEYILLLIIVVVVLALAVLGLHLKSLGEKAIITPPKQ